MSEEFRRIVPPQYYQTPFQSISFKTGFQNCVLKALQLRRWSQTDANWNLQWSQKQRVNQIFHDGVSAHQRTNHFRLWSQLCRKDMLMKNIRKFKRELKKEGTLVEEQWSFMPLTFFLPSEYIMFAEEFKKNGGLWIMKPTSKCQGQGIFIVDKLSQVAPFRHKQAPKQMVQSVPVKPPLPVYNKRQKVEEKQEDSNSEQASEEQKEEQAQPQSYLIQQYLSNPLLFGKKKFDLRIYCVCTNYSSLTAWLYRSGFARFTHEPYNTENIGNLQSHLTNVEIQKHSQNYDEIRGGKWLLDKFKHYLISRWGAAPVDSCFTEIKNIIIRSLQAVQKHIIPSKNSFELYGYDFMIDESLKPWLIEVNGGPSMSANTDFDCKLKCGLVDDVLSIIDIQGVLEGNEMTVGGFDIIIDKGTKVVPHQKSQYQCYLGGRNQRKAVMSNIARKFMTRKKCQEKKNQEKENQQTKNEKKKVKNDKLLPNFYYNNRKKNNNNQVEEIKGELKAELQLLQQCNQEDFYPLGAAMNG